MQVAFEWGYFDLEGLGLLDKYPQGLWDAICGWSNVYRGDFGAFWFWFSAPLSGVVLCDKDSCVNLLFHHFAKLLLLLLLHHRITPNFTTAAFIHSI